MTLDSKLNWEEHIDRVRTKAKITLDIIQIVMKKKVWRISKNRKKTLYSVICRSKLDYDYQLYSTDSPGR